MNRLKTEKQEMILNLLVEGNSIRGIERITGVHRDTIMRLMVSAGENCLYYMSQCFHDLECKHLECDEIWTYVGKKQTNVKPWDSDGLGSHYVYVAMDRDTKLVPLYLVGQRTSDYAYMFMRQLKRRVKPNFQLTTDGFNGYTGAVLWTFGTMIHYAQLSKRYHSDGNIKREGYSPSRLKDIDISIICGNPDPDKICTSYIERQNLTMRTYMKRLNRLTIAFSKKLANLKAALALHFWHYNFIRLHRTLKTTPAIAAGITTRFGNWQEILI